MSTVEGPRAAPCGDHPATFFEVWLPPAAAFSACFAVHPASD